MGWDATLTLISPSTQWPRTVTPFGGVEYKIISLYMHGIQLHLSKIRREKNTHLAKKKFEILLNNLEFKLADTAKCLQSDL